MTQANAAIKIRTFKAGDINDVSNVMAQTQAAIQGLSFRVFYYALCKDALKNEKVVLAVAQDQGRIIGFALAIFNIKEYWKDFLYTHPILTMNVCVRKLLKKIISRNKTNKDVEINAWLLPQISELPSGRRWQESSPSIAKIKHIGVLPAYRGKGAGKQLYYYLFEELAKRGVTRIDANIPLDNYPSIKLHLSTGWSLEKTADNFFATIDLPHGTQ